MSCCRTMLVLFAASFILLGEVLPVNGLLACQERDPASVAPGRRCRKSCTIDDDCKNAHKRCRCDNVCGLSCFNPNATCQPLQLANGFATGGNVYGEVVVYHCNDGFTLEGDDRRTCQSDRKWSGSAPTCRPKRPFWGDWSKWKKCSRSCGGGFQVKRRDCKGGRSTSSCPGGAEESLTTRRCNTQVCPVVMQYENKEYGLFKTRSTFSEAQKTCVDFGGTLAIIKTKNENDAVFDLLRTTGLGRRYYFIGMQARSKPRIWRYLDGDSVALKISKRYQNWGRGEPNNHGGNERCGSIHDRYTGMSWNDINCEHRLNFVCEKITKCTVPEFGSFISTMPNVAVQSVGKNIQYRCDEGYQIVGTTRTELISRCLANKTWSKDPPQCEKSHICNRQPCENGGTCQKNGDGFLCVCQDQHFSGLHCETVEDLCHSSPCLHGGTCTKGTRYSYKCVCGNSYFGQNCERSGCTISSSSIGPGLIIQGYSDDSTYYDLDQELQIKCNAGRELSTIYTTITCKYGNFWYPNYSEIRCI